MSKRMYKLNSGFSLAEMLIALSTGLLVLLGAAGIYSKGLSSSWMVNQKTEMQQDGRAAFNLMTQDISLAGAGLPYGGVGIASGAKTPQIGCDVTSGLCHLGANNTASLGYPPENGSPAINQLYGVVPGCAQGPTINAATPITDSITVAYTDNILPLSKYTVQFNDVNGQSVTFTNPSPGTYQALNNSAVGLNKGDLILFAYGSSYDVAEVTTPPGSGAGPTYNVAFATGDLLQFNQTAATSNNFTALIKACNPTASTNNTKAVCAIGAQPLAPTNTGLVTGTRIYVVTYYIDTTLGEPRLMRQVNALAPVPVADNVTNLNFTYNAYDSNGNLVSNASCNAGGVANASLIRDININMSMRSQKKGASGYQGFVMQSSVSARNLSFTDRYGSN